LSFVVKKGQEGLLVAPEERPARQKRVKAKAHPLLGMTALNFIGKRNEESPMRQDSVPPLKTKGGAPVKAKHEAG
jgi:hypothetical protein